MKNIKSLQKATEEYIRLKDAIQQALLLLCEETVNKPKEVEGEHMFTLFCPPDWPMLNTTISPLND